MAMKARYEVVKGEVIAEKRSGTRRTYSPDPLGSTVALLDNMQAQTDPFTYWPYGEEKDRTGTTPTPFRFAGGIGGYRDSNTRCYLRARYLIVDKGRWLTTDPIGHKGGDINLYRFVFDNPCSMRDRTGFGPECHQNILFPAYGLQPKDCDYAGAGSGEDWCAEVIYNRYRYCCEGRRTVFTLRSPNPRPNPRCPFVVYNFIPGGAGKLKHVCKGPSSVPPVLRKCVPISLSGPPKRP